MVPGSPTEALGSHAQDVRDMLIEVVRSLHNRFAEAQLVSGSRYGMVFGSQWRDLLDNAHDRLVKQGFQSRTILPGSRKLPVVNDCLIYVWRAPDDPNAVRKFASSPTRQACFVTQPPEPTLFDAVASDEVESDKRDVGTDEIKATLKAALDTMPVVLVIVRSTSRQLQSIGWAVADIDATGEVVLHGEENIWEPEVVSTDGVSDVEAFSEGTPVEPVVEPREQEGKNLDA